MRMGFLRGFVRGILSESLVLRSGWPIQVCWPQNVDSDLGETDTSSPHPSTPVTHLLTEHVPSHIKEFHPIITRSFRPPKPSPAGILHIAHAWGVTSSASVPSSPPSERLLPLIMVGDSVDDIAAGYDAGAFTVLLKSEGKEELERDEKTDVVIDRLDDLIELLEGGLVRRR